MYHINQWFCLLHVLLGIADSMSIAEFEDIITRNGEIQLGRYKGNSNNTSRDRSTSICLDTIKSACSLLSTRGHPAAGLPMDFKAFLQSVNSSYHFKPYKHNRFNIIAHNAVAPLFHHHHILQFLSLNHHENQLVSCVKADLEDTIIIAVCRGIAIFHQFITAPLHRISLSQDLATHILDMNDQLRSTQKALEKLSVEPALVLTATFQVDEQMSPLTGGMFKVCSI